MNTLVRSIQDKNKMRSRYVNDQFRQYKVSREFKKFLQIKRQRFRDENGFLPKKNDLKKIEKDAGKFYKEFFRKNLKKKEKRLEGWLAFSYCCVISGVLSYLASSAISVLLGGPIFDILVLIDCALGFTIDIDGIVISKKNLDNFHNKLADKKDVDERSSAEITEDISANRKECLLLTARIATNLTIVGLGASLFTQVFLFAFVAWYICQVVKCIYKIYKDKRELREVIREESLSKGPTIDEQKKIKEQNMDVNDLEERHHAAKERKRHPEKENTIEALIARSNDSHVKLAPPRDIRSI